MHDVSFMTLFLLGVIAIFAGIVDTLAGGGGLITVPALLSVGIPPVIALGTNRLQGCIGELNATLYFMRYGVIDFWEIRYGLFFTIIGSSVGTFLIQIIRAGVLQETLPFLLLGLLIYVVISPKPSNVSFESQSRLPTNLFYTIFGLLIGFYNGFLGPATGSFWAVAFMYFLFFDIKNATMHAKPLNFIGNVASLAWFILAGKVFYSVAASMALGQIIGSNLGSRLVIKKGNKLIRPLFIIVVTIMIIDVFLKNHFKG